MYVTAHDILLLFVCASPRCLLWLHYVKSGCPHGVYVRAGSNTLRGEDGGREEDHTAAEGRERHHEEEVSGVVACCFLALVITCAFRQELQQLAANE